MFYCTVQEHCIASAIVNMCEEFLVFFLLQTFTCSESIILNELMDLNEMN